MADVPPASPKGPSCMSPSPSSLGWEEQGALGWEVGVLLWGHLLPTPPQDSEGFESIRMDKNLHREASAFSALHVGFPCGA